MADAGLLQGGQRVHGRVVTMIHMLSFCLFFLIVGGFVGGAIQSARVAIAQKWKPWDWAKIEAHYQRNIGIFYGGLGGINIQSLVPPGTRVGQADTAQLDDWLNQWWREKYQTPVDTVYLAGAGGAGLGLILFFVYVVRMARTKEKQVRGAELLEPQELQRQLKRKGKPEFDVAGFSIPGDLVFRHMLVFGSPGAGKSQLLADLLDQIRARGERALIYDPGSEFLRTHVRAGDHILNPFVQCSEHWNFMNEIRRPWDSESLALSSIQKSAGDDAGATFFFDGARIVLAEAAKKYKSLGGAKINEIYERLTLSPIPDLHRWLQGTPAATFLDPNAKGQGPGIQATLVTKLVTWQYLPDGPFSIRDWIQKGSGWLFLTSDQDAHAALTPLLSLWVEIAVTELLCRKSNAGERIWIIIDELASLQKMPALLRILSMGRKYRVAVVLATQTPSQLQMNFGKDGANALMGTVGTRIVYRFEHDVDSEEASKYFGEAEVDRQQSSDSAGRRQGGGVNFSSQRAKERIVMPSQIQALPDFKCYLRFAGGFQPSTGKQKLKIRPDIVSHIPVREIPFELKDVQPARESPGLSFGKRPDSGEIDA